MYAMVDVRSLNDKYKNVAGEEIIRSVLANAKKPIATSKFGPNAESFVKLLSNISPNIPIVWIDVVFDNEAFHENMKKLKCKYALNIVQVRAQPAVIEKYKRVSLPEKNQKEFCQLQQDLKVTPFKKYCEVYSPDFWIADIRQSETVFRSTIDKFSYVDRLIKVAPFLNNESVKQDLGAGFDRTFNDVCKPEPHLECGLHLNK